MSQQPLISIVIPVYNEEKNIPRTYKRICALAESIKHLYNFEFIFTDNRSEDRSFNILEALNKDDSRVKVLRFSRNFGYQRSILSGYLATSGAAIIQLDCDLEDPPELIPKFIEEWKAGNDVVYGIRRSRVESTLLSFFRNRFYSLINYLSEDHLPKGAGDFRLIDRKVCDQLKYLKDASPYLRGSISAMGFKQKGIEYDRDARIAGTSKFSMWSNFSLAFDGIFNHSIVPLRIASISGFSLMIITIGLAIGYLILRLTKGTEISPGFTTIVLIQLFTTGMTAAFLGIIGEYIARMYKQVKRGPISIIDQAVGLAPGELKDLERMLE
jgi:polyisoprenyl-phosphate glycosyltransferase